MSRLLQRASRRFFLRHPWQLGLTLLSIALGTAVMVAVDLANGTALRSFDRSIAALAGPMTHEITAVNGDRLDESLYRRLRLEQGIRQALPLIESELRIAGRDWPLAGTDVFALLGLEQTAVPAGLRSAPLGDLLTTPGGVVIPASLAEERQLAVGDTFTAERGGRELTLRVLAVASTDAGTWLADRVLADIATAQDLSGKTGSLDRIQLSLGESRDDALRDWLPPGLQVSGYSAQRATFAEMTEAFRINLTAMSLLAVLVGVFLVYNTMTFAALQRARTFAVLRMTGATGGLLQRSLLGEAAVLAVLGSAAGVVLGLALGQGLLLLTAQTISDLYVEITPTALSISGASIARSVGITWLAVLAATLLPARQAARTAPAVAEQRSRQEPDARLPLQLLAAGLCLCAGSAAVILLSGRSLLGGFVGLFLFVVAYSLCVPWLMVHSLRLAQRLDLARGSLARLALRGVQTSLSRTGLATVALAIAVAATVGVGLMTGAFRASVADWLDTTLRSDLFISAQEEEGRQTLDPRWPGAAGNIDSVASVSTGINRDLRLKDETVRALVLGARGGSARGFDILSADRQAARAMFAAGQGLLVSEPLAFRLSLAAGDSLRVQSGLSGEIDLTVAGVYRDYSSSRGMLVIPRSLYEAHWPDRGIATLGIEIAPGASIDAVTQALQALAQSLPGGVEITTSRSIRDSSLAIFDRTFAVTDVLKILVVLVAFIGVFSALMALFLEKGREFAILRATGMTPGQLRTLVLGQAGLVGGLAGLLSLPLGMALSLILIEVINRRSFGWSMDAELSPGILAGAVLLSLLAALLAALYPARRIARAPLASQLASL
jgi:putative ABC transport system permease protein